MLTSLGETLNDEKTRIPTDTKGLFSFFFLYFLIFFMTTHDTLKVMVIEKYGYGGNFNDDDDAQWL